MGFGEGLALSPTVAARVTAPAGRGMTIDEVMEQFPVSREQVKAALEFAARSLDAPVS